MTCWRRWLLALVLSWPLCASLARAAEVTAETTARRVAVGETFTVEVTAILDGGDGNAQAPKLPIQGAAEVAGPSIGSQRRVVMRNFDVQTWTNIVATYEITPTKPGQLVLGPGSFLVDGKLLQADVLTVEVVEGPPQGSPPSRTLRSPFGFGQDPFGQDPFGRQSGQDPFDQDPFDLLRRRSGLSAYPDAPADLALGSAPNQTGFLVAKLDQPTAILGEPVVLSIYAYGGRGAFREISPMEPALPDFLSYPSVETSHEQPFFRTEIGGHEFLVVKLRELVLVPLRTGELTVGAMRATLRGRGYKSRNNPLGSDAEGQGLTLVVREPPLSDRPPGYRLGDVGRFDLSAEVDPRALDQNGFFSVRLQVEGSGNVPSSLEMPEVPGIVWGAPAVRGEVAVQDRELVGKRTLEFTVRATGSGRIELGSVLLPHFDPIANSYRIASAALGAVDVNQVAQKADAKGPADTPSAEADDRGLLLALMPRTSRGRFSTLRSAPPAWALALAAGAPALTWLLMLLPTLASGAGRRFASSRAKKRHLDLKPLAQLEQSGDRTKVARELEQLAYGLLEEKTGLRARAILKEHLAVRVEKAGIEANLAHDVQALLVSLDAARFPIAGGPEPEDSLLDRARPVLERLSKVRPAVEKAS